MEPIKAGIEIAGFAMEAAGVAVIIVGAVTATGKYLTQMRRSEAYASYRQGLAHSILLGLELLVAGDIIRTVVVAPTIENVAVLGVIVLIRTFLSFTLELEATGHFPWQRSKPEEPKEARPV